MKESKKSKKFGAIIFAVFFGLSVVLTCIVPAFAFFLGNDVAGLEGIFPMLFLATGLLLLFSIVYVLKERLNDLKNGEEDDLDKY